MTVSARLFRDGIRLLTLTGPAGVGKTRLAVAVAARVVHDLDYAAGFVDLAPLRDPAMVLPAIAHGLGIREQDRDGLVAALHDARWLLVLDNFEHVLDAVAAVGELVRECPALLVLVTSRARLRLQVEEEYAVPPLDLLAFEPRRAHDGALDPVGSGSSTGELAVVLASPAAQLFSARAEVVRPGFEIRRENARAVARLCNRLDGIPLAIELAASQMRLLSPGQLL
ncbi:MAG: AAA family ATPase [Dehalococcoidia bacterium]